MEIQGFPRYLIYPDGRVYLKEKDYFLQQTVNHDGYYIVSLNKNQGKFISEVKLVHRLVAQSYLPNPSNHPIVHHKNKNRLDNSMFNLEWTTNMYNTQALNRAVNNNFGCVSYNGSWCYVLHEMGNTYRMTFPSQEEAEEYREITKLFYVGLVLN